MKILRINVPQDKKNDEKGEVSGDICVKRGGCGFPHPYLFLTRLKVNKNICVPHLEISTH
ncbi:MAG: hypothetical protein GF311_14560 [Candidatus Lokiarchaeota archaeon]|nr:hypothetical protein [Candidatus Lokiarchaeota archaeon]